MTARAAMTCLGVSSLPSIKAGPGPRARSRAGLDDRLARERGILHWDGESGSGSSISGSFWVSSSSTIGGHYSSSSTRSSGNANASYCTAARLGKFRAREVKWHRRGGDGIGQQHVGTGRTPRARSDSTSHGYGLHALLLKFIKSSESRLSRRKRRSIVQSGGGGDAPLEEFAKAESAARVTEHNSSEKPQLLGAIPEEAVSRVRGRAGSISFYAHGGGTDSSGGSAVVPSSSRNLMSLLWLLGPSVLVASVVLPPLYLRKFFGAVLEDSLVTDFVILFFTETLFFIGAGVFLYMAHYSRVASGAAASLRSQKLSRPIYSLGYRLSARIALAVGVLLPVASFVIVWPWTGPAAAAALAPYMIGLLAQLGFEQILLKNQSPVWPLVPITFKMYRLHQLNRAAQLVAGLLFSLKGVEATAETMAINGSLQTLLLVLQLLGMLCLWSLGSFLTNQLPTTLDQRTIPSLP